MTILWPLTALLGIVGGVLLASRRASLGRLFQWLPVPLWCYLLPAVLVAGGGLPAQAPAYDVVKTHLLPLALALLLLGTDLRAVARLGPRTLIAFGAGMLGIVLGVVGSAVAFSRWLPPEAWKGLGALAATWTGGSLNLVAVRSILEIPQEVFAPLILVDATIAYGWMALLVAASGWQTTLDRWLGASTSDWVFDTHGAEASPGRSTRREVTLGLLLSLGLAWVSQGVAEALPTGGLIGTANGWTVLLVTTGALVMSLSRRIRAVSLPLVPFGQTLLLLVLASLGAQASRGALLSAPLWLLVGLVVVVVHGLVLLVIGRLLRLPMSLLAAASQANVGGVISAPLVAAVYDRRLVSTALLMALAGNALGTYVGLVTAQLAHGCP